MSALKPDYYRDTEGRWRWKVVSRNNRIIDASSQSFTRRWSAKRNYLLGRAKAWVNG